MSDAAYRKLYVGIRPRLHELTTAHAGTVFMYLLTRFNDRTGQCNVDADRIATDLKINRKTVYKAFAAIKRSGAAVQEAQKGTSSNWSFPVLATPTDHLTQSVGQPTERVNPRNGLTHGTGQGLTRETGHGLTHETGHKEEIEKKRKKSASLVGADAPDPLEAEKATAQTPSASPTTSEAAAPIQTSSASQAHPDLVRLTGYLGYGEPGETATPEQWRALKPTSTNWFHDRPGTVGDIDAASLSEVQLAAWAWMCLNWIRLERGLRTIRPTNGALMGKRGKPGVLGHLIKERGKEGAAEVVRSAMWNHDGIMQSGGERYRPPLDEGFFHHKTTVRFLERLEQNETLDDALGDGMNLEQYL